LTILFVYILCFKRYFRNKLQVRFRSYNQEQSMDINRTQQQPPSYEEANIDGNVSLNNNI
jgi:RecB family endonuclease NucS